MDWGYPHPRVELTSLVQALHDSGGGRRSTAEVANQLILPREESKAASKCSGPISVYLVHLDGFGYETENLAGGAELDGLLHGGRRTPPVATSCSSTP